MKSLTILMLACSCAAPLPKADPHLQASSLESATWTKLETGSSSSLRGVHAVSDSVVWATGSQNTVLRTIDAGASWDVLHLPAVDSYEIRDVHAWSDHEAIVLGVTDPASVWRTSDGGQTWEELFRHPQESAFLDSFTFFDEQHGLLFGDPIENQFLLLRTGDGGQTWRQVEGLPAAATGEAAFAASGTCVTSSGSRHAWIGTGGLQTRVLCSSNGGASWTPSATPMLTGEPTTGIYSVAFCNESAGVIVGGDYTKPESNSGNAAFSNDGGRTWSLVSGSARPRGHRAGVAWIHGTSNALITVGRGGCDFSVDRGQSWSPLSDEGYYAISFSPEGAGYAVGSGGRVGRLELGD